MKDTPTTITTPGIAAAFETMREAIRNQEGTAASTEEIVLPIKSGGPDTADSKRTPTR
jgi:hypothetical protein